MRITTMNYAIIPCVLKVIKIATCVIKIDDGWALTE